MPSTAAAYRIGSDKAFHIHHHDHIDLTRSHPSAPPRTSLLLPTTTTTSNNNSLPLLLDPARTALVIIDMQNFFLSEALGRRTRGSGHAAAARLAERAIPAAREAGIRVVWLNWGLTDSDLEEMPPKVSHGFGARGAEVEVRQPFEVPKGSVGKAVTEDRKGREADGGMGSEMGAVEVDGEPVDAGRMLMRDSWNADLYPPLDKIYAESKGMGSKADVWMHKNRMSGMWGARTMCEEFLEREGLTTLLFTGVNTDQCVSGTLTDAYNKGYDCILLTDGCGTTSPDFAKQGIEYNAGRSWGWLSTCEKLAEAAAAAATK